MTGGDIKLESVAMLLFLVAGWLGRLETGNCCDGQLAMFDGGVREDGRAGMDASVEETVSCEGERFLIGVGCMGMEVLRP